ncbi:hypothetical protein WJX74_004874 [Apatococcus lobatus]|uniref:ATPase AAA-type core domain-containing protein n=1 Tax=Apatococcus lobatus TaxID=904363 RepID=A0AAW1QZK9_9CHLO
MAGRGSPSRGRRPGGSATSAWAVSRASDLLPQDSSTAAPVHALPAFSNSEDSVKYDISSPPFWHAHPALYKLLEKAKNSREAREDMVKLRDHIIACQRRRDEDIRETVGLHSANHLVIPCGDLNTATELFGLGGAYLGSGTDSSLKKFVKEHQAALGVVVLDEFEKLEQEAQEGFLKAFVTGKGLSNRVRLKSKERSIVYDDEVIKGVLARSGCLIKALGVRAMMHAAEDMLSEVVMDNIDKDPEATALRLTFNGLTDLLKEDSL